jgi:tetratricopeptide (TPR) repeat protein
MELRRVGPYRLEGVIGSGGMGVVHAAWDERLERRVALKQIRPEAAGDRRRRERFRREARAVAQLEHPAVVRLYDLLETPDGDWLVLQFAEGETLAKRLGGGPLPASAVAALARDVLGALDAAHRLGVLHRDLKAENVMLSPAGGALVLDFGLAEHIVPAGGEVPPATGLAGTCRAMSPEQANGLRLDPRSDLFSLGVLLYEAATGRSPFAAGSAAQTLARVCGHQPPPVAEVRPDFPPAFSDFIENLLEKERHRRPASADLALRLVAGLAAEAAPPATGSWPARGTTVAGLPPFGRPGAWTRKRFLGVLAAVGIVAGAASAWRWSAPGEPLYVAMARPEVAPGNDRQAANLAASALHAAAQRALSSLAGVSALVAAERDADAQAASPERLARLVGADEVLTARLDCQQHHCLVVLRRLAGPDLHLAAIETFEVPLDDLYLLDTATTTFLRRAYRGFGVRPDAPVLEVRAEDYRRFLELQQRWEKERPADIAPLLASLAAIRAGSPRFQGAYLLEAGLAGRRFFERRDVRDLEHSLELAALAQALAPGDPLPLLTRFDVALAADRREDAEAALLALEKVLPGDVATLGRRALLVERLGEGRRALELLRAAAARRPSGTFLLLLANLENRQGEVAAARRTLEDLLRRLPGHPGGEKLLAQLELVAGSPVRAAELFAGLAGRQAGFAELSNLGVSLLLLGRYEQAGASFEKARALAPQSAAAHLNLADARRLAGRQGEAAALYRRALELAGQDAAHGFWQTLSIKAQAEAHLGLGTDAAATIERAVVAAPANPELAFEAALVYAVIGESHAATASARRALAGGLSPSWFALPSFDPLREKPEFRELFAGKSAAGSPP